MSELKNKSDQNISSAQYLISRSNFASSIHCSYYGCVQLMLHILRSDFNKSEKDIENESNQGSQDERGFHNWLINFITTQFFLRDKYEDSRVFGHRINLLKGTRVKSDYKNKEIKQNEAKESKEYAQKVIDLLEKNFKI